MKKLVTAFGICSLFFLSSVQNDISAEEITLKDAIDKGLVSIESTSLGSYSGKCISLKITSNSRKDLKILVPAGSVFDSSIDTEQDIFLVDDQKFIVKGKSQANKFINGYCCQHSNSAPDNGSSFSYKTHSNTKLLELAKYMSTKQIPNNVKQDAVWAVSDGSSVSHIYSYEQPEVSSALRKKVCEITGQKDVWYNSKSNVTLDAQRNIVREPVSVEGKLLAKIDRAGEIWYEVFDKDGNKASRNTRKGRMPEAGEYNLNFKLTVEGWEKGTYTVKLLFEGTSIYEAEFEV